MFLKNHSRVGVIEIVFPTHLVRHVTNDLPIRPRFARNWQEGSLATDTALRIGNGARFFAPTSSGQNHVGEFGRVRLNNIRNDGKLACANGITYGIGTRHGDRWVGGHHPQCLNHSARTGREQIDSFQTRLLTNRRRAPEVLNGAAMLWIINIEVTSKRIGQSSNFAPTHRIWLPGHRERSRARPSNPARRQMTIEDGIDFISTAARLIHALTENGDDALGPRPEVIEVSQVRLAQTRRLGQV